MAVCNEPSAMPDWSLGTTPATSAVAAATVPVNTPCKARSKTSCWTLATSPISAMSIAPANVARMTIILRPCRSASMPHTGAMTAAPMDMIDVANPAHSATSLRSVTPNS